MDAANAWVMGYKIPAQSAATEPVKAGIIYDAGQDVQRKGNRYDIFIYYLLIH